MTDEIFRSMPEGGSRPRRAARLDESLLTALTGECADFEARMERAGDLADAWEAIRRLPSREREVMRLKYMIGLDDMQIAARLGLSPEDVRRCVARARRRT